MRFPDILSAEEAELFLKEIELLGYETKIGYFGGYDELFTSERPKQLAILPYENSESVIKYEEIWENGGWRRVNEFGGPELDE